MINSESNERTVKAGFYGGPDALLYHCLNVSRTHLDIA